MLQKLKKIPSIHAASGAFGVVSRLPVPAALHRVLSAGGNVVMHAPTLRLPRILDSVASRYQVEAVTAAMLDELVECSLESERAVLQPLFQRYLDQGARGIAIRDTGKVVAYNWAFERNYDLTFTNGCRLLLELPADTLMLGSGYVEPSYRMRGLFPLLIRESSRAFGSGRHCWSSTDIWNEVSLASHMRLGFERVATVACNSMLGVTWFNYRTESTRQWRRVRGALSLSRFDSTSSVPAQQPISRVEQTQ